MESPLKSRRMRREAMIGSALFAVALTIRVCGLSFGLPSFFSGDEVEKRDAALQLAQAGFVHDGRQPSFLYNSLFLIYSAAKSVKRDWALVDYHYMGRLWMAVLGALTVVVVWRIGSKFAREGATIGWVAALLLAVSPLHTACSRYIKEDAPFGLMVTLTVLAAIVCLENPSRIKWILVGLLTGLTFSTKYTGIVLLAPILLAFGVSAWRTNRTAGAAIVDLGSFAVAFWAGFFVFSPAALFHGENFIEGFLFQRRYAMSGHEGIATDPWNEWWTFYLRTGLIPGMTWPVVLLSAAGLGLLVRTRSGWFISVTAVWLYFVLEQGRAKPAPFPARYLMPLLPLLYLSAGVAWVALVAVLQKRVAAPLVYAACAGLFFGPPLVKSLMIADEALQDTRIAAGRWMEENIPSGSTIVMTEGERNLPVSTFWGTRWRTEERDPPGINAPWNGHAPPYFVLSSFKFQRFLESPESVPDTTAFYRQVMGEFELVKEFRPRWLTYGKHSPVILVYRPRSDYPERGIRRQNRSRSCCRSSENETSRREVFGTLFDGMLRVVSLVEPRPMDHYHEPNHSSRTSAALSLAPLGLGRESHPVEERAHPTPVVGISSDPLRGLGERVAAFMF